MTRKGVHATSSLKCYSQLITGDLQGLVCKFSNSVTVAYNLKIYFFFISFWYKISAFQLSLTLYFSLNEEFLVTLVEATC